MPLIYRLQKGSPLTIEEMDDNFRMLHERISLLEVRPAVAETFQEITVEGNHLTIKSSHGNTFGPFILPTVSFAPQGAWAKNKAYAAYDVVCYQEALYVCAAAHTSDVFGAEKEKWRLLLERPQRISAPVVDTKEASSLTLPLYEKAALPSNSSLGSLALVFEQDPYPSMIYGDGQGWRYVHNQKPL
jgi:hypothetical protein